MRWLGAPTPESRVVTSTCYCYNFFERVSSAETRLITIEKEQKYNNNKVLLKTI